MYRNRYDWADVYGIQYLLDTVSIINIKNVLISVPAPTITVHTEMVTGSDGKPVTDASGNVVTVTGNIYCI